MVYRLLQRDGAPCLEEDHSGAAERDEDIMKMTRKIAIHIPYKNRRIHLLSSPF